MKLRAVVLSAMVAALVVPSFSAALEVPSLHAWEELYLGPVRIVPSVRVGYQYMGLNMNVPVPFNPALIGIGPPGLLYSAGALDLKLKDTGFWTGEARIEGRRNGLSVFVAAQGITRKSAEVLTTSDPFWAGQAPVYWRGSRIEGWTLDGGGSVAIHDDLAVVGGFRAEHLSFNLTGATDPEGTIGDFHGVYGDHYSGDLLIKLWEPYIGLRVGGLNYTATFIFSPYTWADVKIPFRYLTVWTPSVLYNYEDARYLFKRNGVLLEGNVDYRLKAKPNCGLVVWMKGRWCQIRGGGQEDYRLDTTFFGNTLFSYGSSDSAVGSLTSYVLAAGLSFVYDF